MMRQLANALSVTGPPGSIYRNVLFWHLAGPVAPTSKAIVHWIGCINAIKVFLCFMQNFKMAAENGGQIIVGKK